MFSGALTIATRTIINLILYITGSSTLPATVRERLPQRARSEFAHTNGISDVFNKQMNQIVRIFNLRLSNF